MRPWTAIAVATWTVWSSSATFASEHSELRIGDRGSSHVRTLTVADLEGFEKRRIVTSSPWFSKPSVFEGVSLSTLIAELQLEGDHLVVTALNDYVAHVPVADAAEHDPLLAYLRDGQYMSVAEMGPLFLIYPFDENVHLRTDVFYSRSVWQVVEIEVR